MPNKLSKFWTELKRRRVIHVIVVYATTSFVIIELINNVFEPLRLPEWTPTFIILILVIGFPIAIIISWIFNISSKRIAKTESAESDTEKKEVPEHTNKAGLSQKSIIVLPFEDMSPEGDQEYFSDGLTEEITADLSQVHDLKVISRSSAMTLKGSNKRLKEIASEINVRYVLEGSVRKAGNDLRITAQLIDADFDTHIWAEKYNGKLDDVFEIQERVSRNIVQALKIKLSPQEEQKLSERPIENIQAFEYWLKARYETFQYQEDNLDRAIDYLKKGLKIIGDNATLYAGLGFVYIQFYNSGLRTNEQTLKEAEKYAHKAFELDPESYLGYFVLGIMQYLQGKIKESISTLYNVLAINPNHTDSLRILSFILLHLIGNKQEGILHLNRLLGLDPYFIMNRMIPLYLELGQGDLEKALLLSESFYNQNPDYFAARTTHFTILLFNRRTEDALPILERLANEHPDHPQIKIYRCLGFCVQNQKDQFLKLFSKEIQDTAWNHSLLSWYLSKCFALINEKEKSIDWLENAVNRGFLNYPYLNKFDPLIENIRSEDRFIKLMERVRFEWENFEI